MASKVKTYEDKIAVISVNDTPIYAAVITNEDEKDTVLQTQSDMEQNYKDLQDRNILDPRKRMEVTVHIVEMIDAD